MPNAINRLSNGKRPQRNQPQGQNGDYDAKRLCLRLRKAIRPILQANQILHLTK